MKVFLQRSRFIYLIGIFLILTMFYACKNEPDFQTTASGLRYRFYVQNIDSAKVNKYDIVQVYMNYRTADSMLFDGSKTVIPFQVNPFYDGDLMEGIMMMHKGDSATFVLDAGDFFMKMMNQTSIPEHVGNNKELFFDIKILSVNPEPENVQQQRVELETRKDQETTLIEKYLSSNSLAIQPSSSGLYYLELTAGKGKSVKTGNKVKVHYNGYFLDGSLFDSSYERNNPITFVVGNNEVIPGLDEGVLQMMEGGKSKLIIPSKIGYGAEQRGNIKPFTTLIFDVELLRVE